MVMRLGLELDALKYTHDIRGVETDAAWRALALRFVYYISFVNCQNFRSFKNRLANFRVYKPILPFPCLICGT